MIYRSIVWEHVERIGLEHLKLITSNEGIKADGLIVADKEFGIFRLRYTISMDADWQVRRCGIFVPTEIGQRETWLTFDAQKRWCVNGIADPQLDGCVGFDILGSAFPKTALIKCCSLKENETENCDVALIDSRNFSISRSSQQWHRLADDKEGLRKYIFESPEFQAEFHFDEQLFVQYAPKQWRIR